MTRIAICDDESIMLDKISLYINTYTTNKQIDNCEIFRFGSAAALIQAMDSGIPFDIFILDIYIGDEIGTSLAKDIRKRGNESPIIFLTTSLEHAPMGYEVGTLRYLIKPIDQTKFFEAMDAAFTQSEKVIKKLNEFALGIHRELSSGREKIEIKYLPNISVEEYELKMEAMLNEDLRKGTTIIGPHKDDYIFIINNKNIGDYGSQGQQKSAILSIKLASVELVKEVKRQYPIVLLDDVFSELDKGRQNQLIKLLNRKAQTIITTPSISDVEPSVLSMARIIELEKRGD